MPGPCFSWTKSISFKAKSITFKSDSCSEISYESRTGSFSSTPLRSDQPPKTPPRRYGCTQGCTPSIANLKEMLQGSGTLLTHRSSSHSSTCVSPSENDAYIHQTKNGEYVYRASEKLKKNRSFLKQYSFNNQQDTVKTGEVVKIVKSKPNLCLVKGCCECSMHCDAAIDGVLVTRDNHHHGSLSPKCVCSKCGEAFLKPDALELHQVVRHAVSELERGNSSLNVIEIIFKTSWVSKGAPIARIERILKIDNTERHISEFHRYRDLVKKAASDEGMQHERCLADGNELLRFYGSSFTCSLGTNGATNLCNMTTCNVCSIIRWGFDVRKERGIYTTATSGKAHEVLTIEEKENWTGKHAMLVCRVIAGRIYRCPEKTTRFNDPSCLPYGYDSISPEAEEFAFVGAIRKSTTMSDYVHHDRSLSDLPPGGAGKVFTATPEEGMKMDTNFSGELFQVVDTKEIVTPQDALTNNVAGILYKWVTYGKGWRPRWFALKEGVFSYYKSMVIGLVAPLEEITISTDKSRQKLLDFGLGEEKVKECEDVMLEGFSDVKEQFSVLCRFWSAFRMRVQLSLGVPSSSSRL